jgi:acetoacetyl-CoA synthetase
VAGSGEVLWEPSAERRSRSNISSYLDRMVGSGGLTSAGYETALAWSVSDLDGFWASIGEWAGVRWATPPAVYFDREAVGPSVGAGPVASGTWCPGGLLNYADCLLRPRSGSGARTAARTAGATGEVAVVARSQTRAPQEMMRAELQRLVAAASDGLLRAGLRRGDRVAAYLPNIPEAIVAFLAAAGIGATWTSCAPEMGVRGVLDRLSQVEPTVLIAVDGYRYGTRDVERGAEVREISAGLPSVGRTVIVPYLSASPPMEPGWWSWDQLVAGDGGVPLPAGGAGAMVPVPFDHPLYVLFSSGTTGKPKPIVHGHGSMLFEHAKALSLHLDLGPGDRFFWYTTTGWMMWNFLVSGLAVGATVVLFDGDPAWPRPGALWDVMADTGTTFAGMGAGYLVAGDKAGLIPARMADLSALRGVGSTGSPLPASAARWVYRAVGGDLALASISGGTDVCTAVVGWSPLHPVWAGEISCRCLGAAVEVFDDAGRAVVGEEGELVLTAPMPSMPVRFWGDADGRRYRESYFSRFPGVWAHGDRMTLTDRGSCVITGRSDGTLNRGGVRMGTAEFYAVVEELPEVADSLVVHVEDTQGGPGLLWLFVVPAAGHEPVAGHDTAAEGTGDHAAGGLGPGLEARIREALRLGLSPRHVPDRIVAVDGVPRTLSGKKLEVPVKRILAGAALERALSVDAVANPEVLDSYIRLAEPGNGR